MRSCSLLRSSCLRILVGAVLLAGCLTACGHPRAQGPGSPPDALDDGWQVSSLEAEDMAPERLAELEQRIESKEIRAPDSLLIARHGKLVYERYWNGFNRDKPHDLRSATKSVTSLLTGVAVGQQLLPGVDTPILPLLQRYAPFKNSDERKEHITVRNLLEMRSGLSCNDWDKDSPGKEEKMYDSKDWVKFILDLPMAEEPGQSTVYCTGGVVVLGALVEDAAGVPFPEFARRSLFEPLGITQVEWEKADGGRTDTGGHLHIRPRDVVKIGQLVLDGGKWQGQQLVPEAWIRESTASERTLGDSKYGYLWWLNTFGISGTPVEAWFARGNGGQYIFVFPSLELVATFTGSFYDEPESDLPIQLVGQFVLTSALRK